MQQIKHSDLWFNNYSSSLDHQYYVQYHQSHMSVKKLMISAE